MATNAPYFQLRGHSQFTPGTNAQFAPGAVDDYDLSASLAPQNASLYSDSHAQDTQPNGLEDSHNFVELLEAATTAAGQAAEAMNGAGSSTTGHGRGKRKRVPSPPAGDARTAPSATPGHKRPRIDVPTDPQLHGLDNNAQSAPGSSEPSDEALLSDARPAGVHSAAALFRRSSKEPSRKYTRPPMSRLFMSLQLSAENFLHLQAQAKSYMLDPTHPERQSCVGNRGKGDTDMVKLRLFNCVRDFLSHGVGEQFFGEHVEKPAEREAMEAARALGEEKVPAEAKLLWPQDGNKIISLVTPLLRRMVTNERQRQYAIETRKGGRKRKEGSVEAARAQESHEVELGGHAQEVQTDFHDGHPLSHTQHLDQQHSAPTTPASSLPARHFASPTHISYHQFPPLPPSVTDMSEEQQIIELSKIKERALPTAEDRVFHLRKICIFLAKNGLKLKQRAHIRGPGPLINYSWVELQTNVVFAIKQALATYPQLRPDTLRSTSKEESKEESREESEKELREQLKGMAPEALRGLAVAATEIHDGNVSANGLHSDLRIDFVSNPALDVSSSTHTAGSSSNIAPPSFIPSDYHHPTSTASETASTRGIAPNSNAGSPTEPQMLQQRFDQYQQVQHTPASQSAPSSPTTPMTPPALTSPSLAFPEPEIPKYIVKTMLTTGLVEVKDEQDWKDVKEDIGYSVWADGKLTVVVELV